MAKPHFSFLGLIIVEATIFVVDFTATGDLVLRPSYGLVSMNVHLNVPEFPLSKNADNSNDVKNCLSH